jgi:hypothetical protein
MPFEIAIRRTAAPVRLLGKSIPRQSRGLNERIAARPWPRFFLHRPA